MEDTVSTPETLGLRFGALAPLFSVQLTEQGFKFSKERVKRFEEINQYITHLKFADILSDAAAEKCRQKLFNQIKKHIKANNKPVK